MQTFLPYSSFAQSAKALDNKRLGKQRVECLQILQSLSIPGHGWANHPACLMWKPNPKELVRYGIAICSEWQSRGFNDTVEGKLLEWADNNPDLYSLDGSLDWIGNVDFHNSHKSNLLRKAREGIFNIIYYLDDPNFKAWRIRHAIETLKWYESQNWLVPPDLPYVWPTKI